MATVFIKSGQMEVNADGATIRTDLGSCIALCLWDRRLKLGGMNHYILPGLAHENKNDLTLGYCANRLLLGEMTRRGCDFRYLEGAIVGGGKMNEDTDPFTVGAKNQSVAEQFLTEHRIPLVFRCVGGCYSRSVEFDTEAGAVQVKEVMMCGSAVMRYVHYFKNT